MEKVMNGGDGNYSYCQNSSYQMGGLERTREMIAEAIAEKLETQHLSSSLLNTFTIADFGCSTGPNTFAVVQNIIEAVELKCKQCPNLNAHLFEFQVYFNDQVANDFNTLFACLPPNHRYFAAGVPGSFHHRLFPKASIHFAHSSYTLNYLSKIPDEVLDRNSGAWNKGRISYGNAPDEVVEAYSAQFAKDIGSFFDARAEELVPGGLMSILLIGTPSGVPTTQSTTLTFFNLMGSTLMDMTKIGLLGEDEVDSFNLPIYCTTQQEFKSLIERNGCFTIEKMQLLGRLSQSIEVTALHFRATLESVFKDHFASEIIDVVFKKFTKKLAESPPHVQNLLFRDEQQGKELFVLVKRKFND